MSTVLPLRAASIMGSKLFAVRRKTFACSMLSFCLACRAAFMNCFFLLSKSSSSWAAREDTKKSTEAGITRRIHTLFLQNNSSTFQDQTFCQIFFMSLYIHKVGNFLFIWMLIQSVSKRCWFRDKPAGERFSSGDFLSGEADGDLFLSGPADGTSNAGSFSFSKTPTFDWERLSQEKNNLL